MKEKLLEDVSASVEEVEETTADTWEQLLEVESEVKTSVWLCQYSFLLTKDEEGNPVDPAEDPVTAGETFVASGKFRAVNRLFQVISATAIRTNIDLTTYDLETEEGNRAVLKDFFEVDGSNLTLSLVELL